MAEVAKAKKAGAAGGGGGGTFDATNFLRQFRDVESRELQQLSATQFMEVWEHYDSDGNNYLSYYKSLQSHFLIFPNVFFFL